MPACPARAPLRSSDARARSRGHDQGVGILALRHELQSLHDSKPMLLVHNHEAESVEDRLLLDKSMRSYNHMDLASRNLFQQFLLLGLLHAAPDDANAIAQRVKDALCIDVMLLGKDLRGRHQRRLVSVLNCNHDGLKRNDGLAAAHVSLQEAIHRIRGLQVVHDFLQNTLLRCSGMKRKNRLHLLPDPVRRFESHTFQRTTLNPAEGEDQLEQEELFEDEPPMIRRLALVQFCEIVISARKMDPLK